MGNFGEWQNLSEAIRRKLFEPGEQLMSMRVEFKKGAEAAPHQHPHEQLTFVISGRLAVTLDGEMHEVQAGNQILIPGGVLHGVKALTDCAVLEVFTPLRNDLLASVTGSERP